PGASGSPAAVQPADLGAAEVSLRQDNRLRAGLANLDPGAAELAGLMDTTASRDLAGALARMQAAMAGPTADVPRFVLATDITPGSAIFAPWAMTLVAYESLMSGGVGNTRIENDRDTLPGCVAGFGSCSGDQTGPKPPSATS